MNGNGVLKWLGEESDRLTEECHSNNDPYKTVNNSFLEGFNYAAANVQALEQPQLNPNQQMVLEWLKEEQTKNPELTIFGTLSVLFDESENRFMNLDVIDALNNLSNPQQEGVFQAFSKWTLGQEEEK